MQTCVSVGHRRTRVLSYPLPGIRGRVAPWAEWWVRHLPTQQAGEAVGAIARLWVSFRGLCVVHSPACYHLVAVCLTSLAPVCVGGAWGG
eukprot:13665-Eustigmatos_ZCMA.PRE.1